jgi:hypothetical protein
LTQYSHTTIIWGYYRDVDPPILKCGIELKKGASMLKKLLLAGACLAGFATASNAATLFTDNFNANSTGLNGIPLGWAVSNGTVDLIGNGFFDFYPGNGIFLDMDGSSGDAGRIDTVLNFNVVAGSSYTISFDYGVNGGAAETLDFGLGSNLFSLAIPAGGIASLTPYSVTFLALATETVSLFFEGQGIDNQGPVLDNVLLEQNVSAVPVPAALPLLAAGLGALGFVARRRRKTAA